MTGGRSTPPSGVQSPPPFNLNTISRGFTTADFYLAVPTAIVHALESDTQTKLVAKPQLRGAEGNKLTMNLGEEVPIVSTSYTPIATGGVGVNPLNSFQLKPVGINIDITPIRVTLDGDILIDLNLENSSRRADVNVAGTNYPSFGTRKVGTRLRLRDGESNLLAGLLREDERKSLNGFPGAIHVPVLKQLFSNNDQQSSSDRHRHAADAAHPACAGNHRGDLRPIYIGSQGNLGLDGPPPLIAQPGGSRPAPRRRGDAAASAPRSPATAPGAAPTGQPSTPPGTTLAPPPGIDASARNRRRSVAPPPAPAPQPPAPEPTRRRRRTPAAAPPPRARPRAAARRTGARRTDGLSGPGLGAGDPVSAGHAHSESAQGRTRCRSRSPTCRGCRW